MKIFEAIFKALSYEHDKKVYSNEERQAQCDAYCKTGREIAKAKKNNKRINGKATYRKNYNKAMKKVNERKEDRDFYRNLF